MILTEMGLPFAKDGTGWRCVEHPELRMTRGDTYHMDGHAQVFASLHDAMRYLTDRTVCRGIS